jgi:ubiquitin carboxyl-terminal hydrolase 22/27/51
MISCAHFEQMPRDTLPSLDALLSERRFFTCSHCPSVSKIHICAQCLHVACRKHLHHQNHYISFCVNLKEFYCDRCNDYIMFEHDSVKHELLPSLCKRKNENEDDTNRKRFKSSEEFKQPVLQPIDNEEDISHENYNYLGLRGLNNLGNTCFMNCILQSLCHNPLIRNYYLSKTKPVVQEQDSHSVALELQTLMSELYRGETKPYDPHCFLYTMWNVAGHLAGYHQQDAHEFLMAILGALSTPGDSLAPANKESKVSNNIADVVFGGELQSDVNCLQCGNTSTTMDPFLDISLHLKTHANESSSVLSSLYECLQRYTRKEKLDRDVYTCAKCGTKQESTKQLTIKSLPIVMCFHLKRFEHGFMEKKKGKQQAMQKIDDFIEFPVEIDLMPYTSKHIEGKENGSSIYSLFSVVQHVGSMESGHYTCYVKHNGQWFLCDDSTVYIANEDDVMSCQAYLLFYVRKTLGYKKKLNESSETLV